jgi:hypothetical protein
VCVIIGLHLRRRLSEKSLLYSGKRPNENDNDDEDRIERVEIKDRRSKQKKPDDPEPGRDGGTDAAAIERWHRNHVKDIYQKADRGHGHDPALFQLQGNKPTDPRADATRERSTVGHQGLGPRIARILLHDDGSPEKRNKERSADRHSEQFRGNNMAHFVNQDKEDETCREAPAEEQGINPDHEEHRQAGLQGPENEELEFDDCDGDARNPCPDILENGFLGLGWSRREDLEGGFHGRDYGRWRWSWREPVLAKTNSCQDFLAMLHPEQAQRPGNLMGILVD